MSTLRTAAGTLLRSSPAILFGLVFYSLVLLCIYGIVFVYWQFNPLSVVVLPLMALCGQVLRLATGLGDKLIEDRLGETDGRSRVREIGDRLVAVSVERGVVILWTTVLSLPVVCLGLAGGTAWSYWQASRDVFAPQSSFLTLFVVGMTPVVVGSIVGVPFRVGSARSSDVDPVRAPATGWSILRSKPVWFGVLVLFRVLPWLAVTAIAVVVYAVGIPPLESTLYGFSEEFWGSVIERIKIWPPVAFVVCSTMATVIRHRITANQPVPTHRSVGSALPGRRTVLAVILVVALVGAPTAAMRITDQKPSISYAEPVRASDPPSEVFDRAVRASHDVDHHKTTTVWMYDETTSEWEQSQINRIGVDYSGKQVSITREDFPSNDESVRMYVDGAKLTYSVYHYPEFVRGILAAHNESWTVIARPEGSKTALTSRVNFPLYSVSRLPEGGWEVVAETNRTITYELTNRSRLAGPFFMQYHAEKISKDSFIRATVAKETGYIRRVYYYKKVNRGNGEVDKERIVKRYRDWETYDAERPDAVPHRSLLELYFDAFGY